MQYNPKSALIVSANPATGQQLREFEDWKEERIQAAVAKAAHAAHDWAEQPFRVRADCLRRAALILRDRATDFAGLITLEMGKLLSEAKAEVEKCALVCEYYAEHGEGFMADEPIDPTVGPGVISFSPLGVILAIMPWNFPFWQVFRCAAPTLMAGNVVLLKHAPNVPQCAEALEGIWREAGCPEGVFENLPVLAEKVEGILADRRVRGVSFTGSDRAGRQVAELAGRYLKKSVLELGGSDPFVVLADADLDEAARVATQSRFLNAGQSCVAAKRFIVEEGVADVFLELFLAHIAALQPGDPMDPATSLAPMARADLRDGLHAQVLGSVAQGAVLRCGGEFLDGPGWYYAPTLLDRVGTGMPAYEDEVFGPVAAVIRVSDEAEALRVANDSRYGLGGSVWTRESARGESFARRLVCGLAFVNGMVRSDPRIPFGGTRDSGYGKELWLAGIREFTNMKTVMPYR